MSFLNKENKIFFFLEKGKKRKKGPGMMIPGKWLQFLESLPNPLILSSMCNLIFFFFKKSLKYLNIFIYSGDDEWITEGHQEIPRIWTFRACHNYCMYMWKIKNKLIMYIVVKRKMKPPELNKPREKTWNFTCLYSCIH